MFCPLLLGFYYSTFINLYCQSYNFDVPLLQLVKTYPLERVREIHISGGKLYKGIWCDSHDREAPQEMLSLLPQNTRHVSKSNHRDIRVDSETISKCDLRISTDWLLTF